MTESWNKLTKGQKGEMAGKRMQDNWVAKNMYEIKSLLRKETRTRKLL